MEAGSIELAGKSAVGFEVISLAFHGNVQPALPSISARIHKRDISQSSRLQRFFERFQ
jgi:hypothetical protein